MEFEGGSLITGPATLASLLFSLERLEAPVLRVFVSALLLAELLLIRLVMVSLSSRLLLVTSYPQL